MALPEVPQKQILEGLAGGLQTQKFVGGITWLRSSSPSAKLPVKASSASMTIKCVPPAALPTWEVCQR